MTAIILPDASSFAKWEWLSRASRTDSPAVAAEDISDISISEVRND